MTLSSIRIAVLIVVLTFSRSSPAGVVWALRLMEPRLQTAVSSFDVLSKISVQRFELWMVPTCDCGDRRFEGSLNVIQGWPVSKSMESIFRQRSTALISLNNLIFPWAACFS